MLLQHMTLQYRLIIKNETTMRRFYILSILFVLCQHSSKAQYNDINMFINQMQMNMNMHNQQMNQLLMDAVNAEMKRQDAAASANCVFLPYGEDCFYAHVGLMYIKPNNVKIIIEDIVGDADVVSPSQYSQVGYNIITNSIFEPGTTIYVRRKDTNKLLAKASIPFKSSPDYERFLANAYAISQQYSNMISSGIKGNSTSTYNNSTSSGTTSRSKHTCSFCNGKGWRTGSKTPTYGSTTRYWCEECDRMVNPSHSHDMCPSCRGRGYIIK